MEHDFTTIIISGLYFLIVSLYILLNPQKWKNYSEFSRLLIAGFMVLFLVTVSNTLIEGHRDIDYLINFLTLKVVGRWLFRVSASLGYSLILWGVLGILVIKFKKTKKNA